MRENNGSVSQCNVLSTSFSDHDAIVGLTTLNSSLTDCRVVSSRNLRKINSAETEADIQHLLDTELADCTDIELADRYSAGLRRVLDQHAPLTSRKVANRPSAPWRTDSVRTAKRELRQAKRKWRSSGLTVYKELYSAKLIAYTASVRKAKRQYYNDVICNCPSSKQLNFRPVSNLPFLSKILEKVVLAQLESHLSRNNLRDVCQSAYRQNHSTETLLLSVTDSLLCKADNRLVSLLTLLDQSAAFDTVYHKILLNRLSYTFGISVTVFKWFISYLTNRTQSVSVGDLNSLPLPLKYGVPQGSVLGPILFTLYSQPVSDKIREHNISYQKFADDTQLHKASQPTEFQI